MNADCAAACLHRRVSVFIGGHCFGVKAKTTAKQRGHEFHESTRSQCNGCNRQGRQRRQGHAMRLRHFKDIRLNQRLPSRVSAVVRSNGKTPRREDAEFRGGKPCFHLTRESRQARAANAVAPFCTRLALSVSSTHARPRAVCPCALGAFLGVSASRRFALWAIALRTRPRAHHRAALFASHCARTRALARAWLSRLVYLASLAYLAVHAVAALAPWSGRDHGPCTRPGFLLGAARRCH